MTGKPPDGRKTADDGTCDGGHQLAARPGNGRTRKQRSRCNGDHERNNDTKHRDSTRAPTVAPTYRMGETRCRALRKYEALEMVRPSSGLDSREAQKP